MTDLEILLEAEKIKADPERVKTVIIEADLTRAKAQETFILVSKLISTKRVSHDYKA